MKFGVVLIFFSKIFVAVPIGETSVSATIQIERDPNAIDICTVLDCICKTGFTKSSSGSCVPNQSVKNSKSSKEEIQIQRSPETSTTKLKLISDESFDSEEIEFQDFRNFNETSDTSSSKDSPVDFFLWTNILLSALLTI